MSEKFKKEDLRLFIRHPSDIPIEICSADISLPKEKILDNISVGGLSFISNMPFEENSVILIKIPLVNPVFEAKGMVIWCNNENQSYDIGVAFIETKDAFRIRMVEQICHIEHYKKEIQEKEGRLLTGREAALEWINKYAGSFQKEISEEIKK